MNIEDYLTEVLCSLDLTESEEKTLTEHKKEIEDYLIDSFDSVPSIKFAGSWAKKTMIREKYDLDVVCYFPSSDERTLEEIRNGVRGVLSKYYTLKSKSSAERILDVKNSLSPQDFHIDVVPGRFIADSSDVFLHVKGPEKDRMKTNLKTHVEYIRDSGFRDAIRLVKFWAVRNGVDVRTFILEIFVIKILQDFDGSSLSGQVIEVLASFVEKFETIRLEDPANSNNVVSELMTPEEKKRVSEIAKSSLDLVKDAEDSQAWATLFGETNHETAEVGLVSQEEALPLGDISHKQKPNWPRRLSAQIVITGCQASSTSFRSNAAINLKSNGFGITNGFDLKYTAQLSGVVGPYEVFWQVVNTGSDAASDNALRGSIEKAEDPKSPLCHRESSRYSGKHIVQCYVVQDGVLVAESAPFYVNILNRRRDRIRNRRR